MSMSLSSPSTSSGSIYQRRVRRPPPPSGPRLRGRQSSALATPITLFDSSNSSSGLSYNASDAGSPPGTPAPFSPPPSYHQHSQPPASPVLSIHSNSSSFRADAVASTPAPSTLATEEEGMEVDTNPMRPRVGSYIATSSTTSSHAFSSTLYTSSPTSSPSPPPQSTSTSPTSAPSLNDHDGNGNGKGLSSSLSAIEGRDSEYPRMKLGDIGEEEDRDGVGVQVEARLGGARVRPSSALQSPLSPISPLSPPPLVDSDDDDLTDDRHSLSPSPPPPHPPHSYPHSSQSTPSRSTAASTPTPTTTTTPVPKPSIQHLSPPPPINYDSVPLKWKSLPLEAAMWTFTSKELQHIVSRAIRTSARESFIRLLSLNILDNELPNEIQRLDHAKLTAQARYRFCVHRRTMLLQAVNACSMLQHTGGGGHIAQLAAQLSETTAECDQLLEQMMRIVDQQAQCVKLQDVHWASALAVALRKLNTSYGKRTAELKAAKERISQLEAELEEAWKEAETIARELDDQEDELEEGEVTADVTGEMQQQAGEEDLTEDLTASVDRGGEGSDTGEFTGDEDQEEAHVIVAEHLTILKSPPAVLHDLPSLVDLNSSSNPASPTSTSYVSVFSSPPTTPTPYGYGDQPNTPRPMQHTRYPSAIASEMSYQITSMDSRVLAASPPPLPAPTTTPIVPQADVTILRNSQAKDDDAATIHSVHSTRSLRSTKSAKSTKSTKSTRSVRPPGTSRVSQVFAARRRSIRASLGSLRIPKLRHGSRHASSMSAGGIADAGVGDGDGGAEGRSNRPPVPELPSAYIRKPSVSITTMASTHSKSPSTTLPPSSSSSSVVSPASVRRVFSFGRYGKAQHPNLLLQSHPQTQQPQATLPAAGASPGTASSLRSRKPRMSVDDIQVVPRSPRYDVTPSRPSAVDDIGIDARSGAHLRRMSGVGGIGGVSGLMKRLEWVMGGEAEGAEEARAEGAPNGGGGDGKVKDEVKLESNSHPLSATSKALHSLKTSPERLFHRVNGSSSSSTSASSTATTSTPSPGGILHNARKRYTMSFPLFTGSNTAASSATIPDSTPPSASTSRLGLGPKMRPASSAQYSN